MSSSMVEGQTADNRGETAKWANMLSDWRSNCRQQWGDSKMVKYSCLVGGQAV